MHSFLGDTTAQWSWNSCSVFLAFFLSRDFSSAHYGQKMLSWDLFPAYFAYVLLLFCSSRNRFSLFNVYLFNGSGDHSSFHPLRVLVKNNVRLRVARRLRSERVANRIMCSPHGRAREQRFLFWRSSRCRCYRRSETVMDAALWARGAQLVPLTRGQRAACVMTASTAKQQPVCSRHFRSASHLGWLNVGMCSTGGPGN